MAMSNMAERYRRHSRYCAGTCDHHDYKRVGLVKSFSFSRYYVLSATEHVEHERCSYVGRRITALALVLRVESVGLPMVYDCISIE
jgi:hypothetical protein